MNFQLNPIEVLVITAVIQAIAPFIKGKIPAKYIADAVMVIAVLTECVIGLIHGGITVNGILLAIGTSGVNSQIFNIVKSKLPDPTAPPAA